MGVLLSRMAALQPNRRELVRKQLVGTAVLKRQNVVVRVPPIHQQEVIHNNVKKCYL